MYRTQKVWVVIPAAGRGTRMGTHQSKLLVEIGGEPLIGKTLRIFQDHPAVDAIVLVTGDDRVASMQRDFSKIQRVVPGGQTRQASIRQGLDAIPDAGGVVLIHDGARPRVSADLVDRILEAAVDGGAAIPALPVVDTIKQVHDGRVDKTLRRSELVRVQTPQGFDLALLREAYARGDAGATDDAMLVEQLGHPVLVVPGDERNIKLTHPEDLEHVRGGDKVETRVGIGYDVHRLVEGRPLILGGVTLPHEKGLLGHSDADVLIHAIMDALLGAAGAGDIGQHFPDHDSRYKGISSLRLLEEVRGILHDRGYNLVNIDATVMAQQPKLAPHLPEMTRRIAAALDVEESRINLKATTTERLGFVGLEEGMAAEAIAMVDKR